MSENNNGDLIEIIPLQAQKVKLEEGKYAGRFTGFRMETAPKRLGLPRKDLILTVKLDKDQSGNPVTVEHTFNCLPGKRGKSHFKSCMSKFLKRDISDADLASFKKSEVMERNVICEYKPNRLGNAVVFVTYLPAK